MVTRRWSQQNRVFGAYLGAHTEHSQSGALGYALHAIEKAMTSLYEEELAAAEAEKGEKVEEHVGLGFASHRTAELEAKKVLFF